MVQTNWIGCSVAAVLTYGQSVRHGFIISRFVALPLAGLMVVGYAFLLDLFL
jgi:hypothetical protein